MTSNLLTVYQRSSCLACASISKYRTSLSSAANLTLADFDCLGRSLTLSDPLILIASVNVKRDCCWFALVLFIREFKGGCSIVIFIIMVSLLEVKGIVIQVVTRGAISDSLMFENWEN
jgi:hypothetical protein